MAESISHELWLIYKELEEVETLKEVWPLRDRLGKTINRINRVETAVENFSKPGAALGSIKSEAKAKSSAENGKRGGRPRTIIRCTGAINGCSCGAPGCENRTKPVDLNQ